MPAVPRRSIQLASPLQEVADWYRRKYLDATAPPSRPTVDQLDPAWHPPQVHPYYSRHCSSLFSFTPFAYSSRFHQFTSSQIHAFPNTVLNTPLMQSAPSGTYVCIHSRREDYSFGHPGAVPSLPLLARQITRTLLKHNLLHVYLATDAPLQEIATLRGLLAAANPLFVLRNFVANNFSLGIYYYSLLVSPNKYISVHITKYK